MSTYSWFLEGLKYPRRQQFAPQSPQEVRGFVVWLENQKIRFYKPPERAALSDVNNPNWNQVFIKYLKDVECPIPYNGQNNEDIVSWLAKHAVSLEYSDHAKDYNGYAATKAFKAQNNQQQMSRSRNKEAPYQDAGFEEFQKLLEDLFRTLQVDTSKGNAVNHLKEAKEILQEQVLPGIANSKETGTGRKGLFDMSQFPLGFRTGDKRLDVAATVLRVLYIKDLRNLQSQIDHAIVELQEYSANPKTDSRLGRVGH